jgi:hypothetical protein
VTGEKALILARPLGRAPWAAWLAILALGLNALIPIHLALDLGEVLAAAHHRAPAPRHGLEWRLLALATGHDPGDGRPDGDEHRPTCPAFAALGALAGFAVVAPPALPTPANVAAAPVLAAVVETPDTVPAAAYRSRAPPFG